MNWCFRSSADLILELASEHNTVFICADEGKFKFTVNDRLISYLEFRIGLIRLVMARIAMIFSERFHCEFKPYGFKGDYVFKTRSGGRVTLHIEFANNQQQGVWFKSERVGEVKSR